MKEALWLTEHGFELVPLNEDPNDKYYRKRPRDKNWRTKSYKLDELQASFRRSHAIGARVPAGMCVIDIDVKDGKKGLESIAKFPQEGLFDTAHVVTGSGGFHLFFRLPEGIDKIDASIRELKDIDFRGLGHQVVTAGSINKEGGKYEWDEGTQESKEVVIKELPPAIWDFLKALQRPDVSTEATSVNTNVEDGAPPWENATAENNKVNDALSRTEIEGLLGSINVEDYRDHEEWLKVMMATHEASGGGLIGLDAFYEWCQTDSMASVRVTRGELEKRWKSLDSKADRVRGGGITRRFLEFIATPVARAAVDFGPDMTKRVGAPSTFVRARTIEDAKQDLRRLIEGVGTDTGMDLVLNTDASDLAEGDPADWENSDIAIITDDQIAGPLSKLNETHAYITISGKARVARQQTNMYGQNVWNFLELSAFHAELLNQPKIQVTRNEKTVAEPLSFVWMEWSGRRTYAEIDFFPGMTQEEVDREYPGSLNLWSGWAVDPIYPDSDVAGYYDDVGAVEPPALCSQFIELIGSLSGEGAGTKNAQYLLDWISFSFAAASKPAGVAVAFRGRKGIGKGILGSILGELVGNGFTATADMNHVVGQFNGNLRNTIFLFLDEALWSGSKQQARKLQTLITEAKISTEIKGLQSIYTRNCLHIMMASNDEWVVPASGDDERRYCVYDSLETYRTDRGFWTRIVRDYNIEVDGLHYKNPKGLERLQRLLGWFLARGEWLVKNGWRPSYDIPKTDALEEQKQFGATSFDLWWADVLDFGELGGLDIYEVYEKLRDGGEDAFPGNNAEESLWIWNQKVYEDFAQSEHGKAFEKLKKYDGRGTETQLGKFIASKMPRSWRKKRVVPKDLRLDITCSALKSQANSLELDLRDIYNLYKGEKRK